MDFSTLIRSRPAARLRAEGPGAGRPGDGLVHLPAAHAEEGAARPRPDRHLLEDGGFPPARPGELGRLAESERTEKIRRKLGQAPEPLFQEFRDLVLRKVRPGKRDEVRAIFEGQPFGTLERLITQTLLEVVQRIARQELDSESWIRLAARVGGRSHEEMRVIVLEFLDTDVFHVSNENCAAFIDPLVESWDIDLDSFRLDVMLNRSLVAEPHRTFTFVESTPADELRRGTRSRRIPRRPASSSADVTEEEVRLLRQQRFDGRRPNKLYYYRALQNLRDRLLFDEQT